MEAYYSEGVRKIPAQGCALATLGKQRSFLNSATLKGFGDALTTAARNSFRVARSLIDRF